MDQRSPLGRRALIVEDEPMIALDLEAEMHALGFGTCQLAAEAQEAFLLALGDQLDVVLMNVDLQGGHDGIEAARWLREVSDALSYSSPDTLTATPSSISTNRCPERQFCQSRSIVIS